MNFRGWLSLQERITVAGQEFRDTDALAALKRLMSTHPNPENLVVTLTEIDKVGVNPKTQYETPLGIYFYPLDYAVGLDMRVPFAADVNFIQVCELTEPDKIIHMRPLTPQDPASFAQHKGVDMLYAAYGKENIDDYIEILRSQNFVPRSDYAVFYMLTALVAWHRNDQRDRVQPVRVRSNAPVWDELGHTTPLKARIRGVTGWNKVFRELGLAGIIDHGTETIYLDEPVQGVVFSAGALRRILSLENPKSPTAAPQYSRFGRQMVSNKPDQLAALTRLASKSIDDAKKYIRHTNFYNYRLRGSNLYANIMAATDGKIDEREMFSLLGNNRHLSAGELYALFA
ncbi:MAG: hypothetical protein EBS89_14265, partial [Proteobacteria bacterium]|nr:hypothetical protein [Pseudomonadota bacterium]